MAGSPTTYGVFISLNTLATTVIGIVVSRMRGDREELKNMGEQLHLQMQLRMDERQELTEKLIDERLRRISHDMDGHSQRNMGAVDAVTQRMDSAMNKFDATLDRMNEKDHGLEIKLLKEVNAVQREIAQNAVTKDDMARHERQVENRMGELKNQIDGLLHRKGGA